MILVSLVYLIPNIYFQVHFHSDINHFPSLHINLGRKKLQDYSVGTLWFAKRRSEVHGKEDLGMADHSVRTRGETGVPY